MFRVTFRDEKTNQNLTKSPLLMQAIPVQGEMVYIREYANSGSSRPPQTGRVTSRHWLIASLEPDESEVILMMAMEK